MQDPPQAWLHRQGNFITGGDAEDLLPLLQVEAVFLPDMVLQGLAVIYQSMQEGDL